MKAKNALMVLSLLLVGSVFGQGSSQGQEEKAPSSETFIPVDSVFDLSEVMEQPEFPGGMELMYDYLSKNIRYPDLARQENAQGTVYVRFIVDEEGELGQVEIMRGVRSDLDEETMRVVREMPRWIPGRVEGRNVKVRLALPVVFKLEKRR